MRCTYCGSPYGDSLDHVVPYSWMTISSRRTYNPPDRERCVPCCRECNSGLGNKMFHTIGSRAAYLVTYLKKRYAKELRIPRWDEEDFEEVCPKLRAYAEHGMAIAEDTRLRIEHCKMIALTCPSIKEVWDDLLEAA